MKKLNSILLIDDDHASNFLHKMIIQRTNCVEHIKVCISAQKGLDYLINKDDPDYQIPDIIYLDINMPGMNGWEFLEEYKLLSDDLKAKIIIVMLSSTINPDDVLKANESELVNEFVNKPLTRETLLHLIKVFYNLEFE